MHTHLAVNVSKLCKDKEDPLRLILNDLGEAPVIHKDDELAAREIQLTLVNR